MISLQLVLLRQHDVIHELWAIVQSAIFREMPDVVASANVLMPTFRYSAADTGPSALISHATLVAACGEAAKYFKPYQVRGLAQNLSDIATFCNFALFTGVVLMYVFCV